MPIIAYQVLCSRVDNVVAVDVFRGETHLFARTYDVKQLWQLRIDVRESGLSSDVKLQIASRLEYIEAEYLQEREELQDHFDMVRIERNMLTLIVILMGILFMILWTVFVR